MVFFIVNRNFKTEDYIILIVISSMKLHFFSQLENLFWYDHTILYGLLS